MKHRIVALFCALTLLVCTLPASALEGEALRTADTLATLGLVEGNGTDYALDAPVTRAQAAVLLTRLSGATKGEYQHLWSSGFRDLPDWCVHQVAYAYYQGWVQGVSQTEFRPNGTVTANAWFTMLLRMLGYSDKDGDFTVHDAPAFAQRIGLTSQSLSGVLTRGQVFESMREALTFSCTDGSGTVIDRLLQKGVCSRAAANALGLLDQELTARQIADRHMAAVFCLDVYRDQEAVRKQEPSGNASGFFITADGLAVTNFHSIEDGIYATATLSTGEVYEVTEVVYYDAEIDSAVLRVSQTSTAGKATSAFACLEVAGTGDIRPGDRVYTLGNPLGLGLAVSEGIISDIARPVERYALPCVMNTADISSGSSGGALMNVYGQVIAVTSGAYTYGNSMYLAVPTDPVLSADLTAPGRTLAEVAALTSAKEA